MQKIWGRTSVKRPAEAMQNVNLDPLPPVSHLHPGRRPSLLLRRQLSHRGTRKREMCHHSALTTAYASPNPAQKSESPHRACHAAASSQSDGPDRTQPPNVTILLPGAVFPVASLKRNRPAAKVLFFRCVTARGDRSGTRS